MIEMYLIIAGALVLAGAIAGVLTVVAVGIHREERAYSLTTDSPDRITSGSRAANGLYARRPGVTHQIGHPRADHLALAGPGPRI
jgi:hypothetical protein